MLGPPATPTSPGDGTVGVAPVPAVAPGAAAPARAVGMVGVVLGPPVIGGFAAVGGMPVLGDGIMPTGAPLPPAGSTGAFVFEPLQPSAVNGSAMIKKSDRFMLERVVMSDSFAAVVRVLVVATRRCTQ